VAGSGGGQGGSSATALGWSLGVIVLVALSLTPAALRRIRRRRRLTGSTGPAALWAEILDTAVDLGLPPSPNLSPRRLVQLWSRGPSGERTMPEITRSVIMDIAHAEELDRYANGATGVSGGAGPGDAAARLPQALKSWERSRGAAARWRAWLAPQSMIAGVARWRAALPWAGRMGASPLNGRLGRFSRLGRVLAGRRPADSGQT
jgi:hypothetical protein